MAVLPLILVVGTLACGADPSIAPRWPGWNQYQVIMWSTGQTDDIALWFERLREMECTAEECYRGRDPAPFVEKDEPEMPITERGQGLAPIFEELKRIVPTLIQAERITDPIAIHYSQASLRAHWMFESRKAGNTWPRRFSSYEAKHSLFARVRDSFVRIVEDLGLQYRFISYEQLENGELIDAGYKVLLLPQSVAMSAKECEQVRVFVKSGGTVIADNMTATMDDHCRQLAQGQLDDRFGIRRTNVLWATAPPTPTMWR